MLYPTDDDKMKNTHYRLTDDMMGSPQFNGIRVDAHESYPIKDLEFSDIIYTSIGYQRIIILIGAELRF